MGFKLNVTVKGLSHKALNLLLTLDVASKLTYLLDCVLFYLQSKLWYFIKAVIVLVFFYGFSLPVLFEFVALS